jgi:IS30 family transposase
MKQKFKQLTLIDRINIQIYYQEGLSIRAMSRKMKRSPSSISRELGGRPSRGVGKYQAYINHQRKLKSRLGKKQVRLKNDFIKSYVVEKMVDKGWTPEQISLRLPIDHPGYTISHEAIYQYVYAQIRRGGNDKIKEGCKDLRPYLTRRHTRRQRKGFRQAQKAERPVLPSIEQKPTIVNNRARVGDWEDDTIVSRQSDDRLKTINERVSGVVLIGKMKDGTIRVVKERLGSVPKEICKTLTRNRGTENMGYKELEEFLGLDCYFGRAYCSQDRGSNENINGLIRRYFPKKTDFSKISDEQIKNVEYLINTRPRKRHGGKTPLEVLLERTGVAITY